MNLRILATAALAATTFGLTGCASNTIQSEGVAPDRTAVTLLGITSSPITADEAKAIAAQSLGGVAISVETSDEKGDPAYEVKVRVDLIKEVQVRISDGAILNVETDDDQGNGDNDDDDDGSDNDDGDNDDEGGDQDDGDNDDGDNDEGDNDDEGDDQDED